ncbi:MAG: hypothetical protein BGO76_01350 [Caedibacter sp. 38-128]|nr:MAG: hypothetical protein BGO76_01350 [Caedibacter sp. 38-128]
MGESLEEIKKDKENGWEKRLKRMSLRPIHHMIIPAAQARLKVAIQQLFAINLMNLLREKTLKH